MTVGDARDGDYEHAGLEQLAACAAHGIQRQLAALQRFVNSAIRHTDVLQSKDARLTDGDLEQLLSALAQVQEAAAQLAAIANGMASHTCDSEAELESVRLDQVTESKQP